MHLDTDTDTHTHTHTHTCTHTHTRAGGSCKQTLIPTERVLGCLPTEPEGERE
jgi:hypothetical protein